MLGKEIWQRFKNGEQCAAVPHSAIRNDKRLCLFPSPSPLLLLLLLLIISPSPENPGRTAFRFPEIWNAIPHRGGQPGKNAEKAYRTARKKISHAALLEALTAYVNFPVGRGVVTIPVHPADHG